MGQKGAGEDGDCGSERKPGGGGETAWREKDDLPDLDQLSFSPGALKKPQKIRETQQLLRGAQK